jgi:hypothetical protein
MEEEDDAPLADVARRLLAAYGASGHPTDRLLLRCLRLLEAHNACNLASLVRLRVLAPHCSFLSAYSNARTQVLRWRPSRKSHEDDEDDEELDDEACAERLLTLVQEGRALTPARLLHSHSHFIATTSDDVDAHADSRACGCNRRGTATAQVCFAR